MFGLGMAGFAPEERRALESLVDARTPTPRWRVCAFSDADAWWINGARLRVMQDGNLRIAAGLPSEKALRLDLPDIDRPIAFATPLPADFDPYWQFDPHSAGSIESVLMQFNGWLWQARAKFVLGARIIEAPDQLTGGVFHVSHESRLLAVIDFEQGKAAYLPRVHPVALAEATWSRRPRGANDLPEKFVRTTPAELVWTYASHTERDVLPRRYRKRTMYHRRVPRVPLRMLRDSQLLILFELSSRACDLDELERRTALPRERLERDLACLYYANAITTSPGRAGIATVPDAIQGAPGALPDSDGSVLSWDESLMPPTALAPTAPVMLDRREDTTIRASL